MSIKPVALFGGTRSNDSEIWARRLKDWELPARDTELYAIPDTHRVVPIELLYAIEIDMTIECTNINTLNKLRAIIEDKP